MVEVVACLKKCIARPANRRVVTCDEIIRCERPRLQVQTNLLYEPSLVMSSSEVKETKENLFPEIRHVAEETDQLPDVDDDEIAKKRKETDGDEDEEAKPVQEIESLCMNCEKMVSANNFVKPAGRLMVFRWRS